MRRSTALLYAALWLTPGVSQAQTPPPAASPPSAPTVASTASALLAKIRARDAAAVEAALTADPSLARAELQPNTTALMAAAVARNGTEFVRPEDNPAYGVIARRITEPNIFEAALLGDAAAIARIAGRSPAEVNRPGPAGWTPLHFAAYAGQDEAVRALLKSGAQIDRFAGLAFGTTPVQAALLGRRIGSAELLLRSGASPFARTSDGGSYLHEAAILNDADMVHMLARNGVPIRARRDDGQTAAETAEARGSLAAATALRAVEAAAARQTPKAP